ncbi:phosphatidylinositol N-acetylglucosaminyltransferase subunit H [Biomphalaria glabrata]|nr:phosphatidylinositol N-acetylglucosaminyltransferase subunit H-like [Biomphalaria glabrata]
MVVEMQHRDLGDLGSEFIVIHPSLKNRALFVMLLLFTIVTAFFFGLHLLDETILTSLCFILIVSLIFKLSSKIHSENLLILPSLGLQVETTYYLGYKVTQFIHLAYIKDIVINEAITMHSIMHYLLVLLKSNTSNEVHTLQPLFEHSWPSLSSLKPVYRAAQKKLIKPQLR